MSGKDIFKIAVPLVVIGIIILVARSVDDGKLEKERKTSVRGVVDSVFAEEKDQELSIFARLKTGKGMVKFPIDKYMRGSGIMNDLHKGDSVSKDSGVLAIILITPNGNRKEYKYIE